MAAFDTPWSTYMAPETTSKMSEFASMNGGGDPKTPIVATFSPTQNTKRQRKTVLVQQKSPLLIATPPQITRALAFSHPFLLPLSRFMGLVSWSSGDPWESFLLVAAFWAIVLLGGDIIRYAGPLLGAAGLVAGMYSRRYSPLSTTAVTGEKVKGHKKEQSESNIRHQKSLDEIVNTMNDFTAHCNLMLEPLLDLTDFLSTQQSATSATTRPALTTLFTRFLMISPVWIILTFPPFRIITTQRVVLVIGTIFLTWHSRPARISRTILWRSLTVRRIVSLGTGLDFANTPGSESPGLPSGLSGSQLAAAKSAASAQHSKLGVDSENVRFTFTVYENQRRWLGLGWTSSMFAYERAAWTDEHLIPAPPKEEFKLPAVDGGLAIWRWVKGSEWRTESSAGEKGKGKSKEGGWVYYDNKWADPRRHDGWGRYTRRRKWFRDAELVEASAAEIEAAKNPPGTPKQLAADLSSKISPNQLTPDRAVASGKDSSDTASVKSAKRKGFFRKKSSSSIRSETKSRTAASDDETDKRNTNDQTHGDERDVWEVGDDMRMGLG